MIHQYRGRGSLLKPKAEADNTDSRFDNSWYHAKTDSIIVLLYIYWPICPRRHFSLTLQKFVTTTRTRGLETTLHTLLYTDCLHALDRLEFSYQVWCKITRDILLHRRDLNPSKSKFLALLLRFREFCVASQGYSFYSCAKIENFEFTRLLHGNCYEVVIFMWDKKIKNVVVLNIS